MYDLAVALARSAWLFVSVVPRAVLYALWWTPPPEWPRPVTPATRTVVVLLHGVNQRHAVWKVAVERLLPHIPADCAVYAPFFNHNDDPLGALADAVQREIEPHVKRGLAARIVGFSNGGRIAMYIQRDMPGDHTFVLVGAPVCGTHLLRWLPDALVRAKISPHLLREMSTVRFYPRPGSRIVAFAADYDEMVFPAACCAPHGTAPRVLRGHMHRTLFRAREVVAAIAGRDE